MLFKHYILTRFNLIDTSWYNTTIDHVNSDEFLSARFSLFETYCFPSVKQQSNNNFTWFVLFNDQLPEKWRKKLDEYKQEFPNFEVRFMSAEESDPKNWNETLNHFVLKELKNSGDNVKFVLTTRFDNDDAIHLSFVDSIQKYFLEHREEMLINYANGLQYIPQYNVLKNLKVINGHFGTLAEKNTEKIRTVFSFSHNPLPDDLPAVKSLKTKKPMWLEVLHNTNVFNAPKFRLGYSVGDLFFIGFKHKNLNDFGIEQNLPRVNFYIWKVFFKWFFSKLKKKTIDRLAHK